MTVFSVVFKFKKEVFMNKLAIVAFAALFTVGCASKGSVEVLTSRVDALEANHANIVAEHNQIKADHEALKGDIADLGANLDKAFVKKNQK
jgi:outer membrane murein-binding lipoprotein Lpp